MPTATTMAAAQAVIKQQRGPKVSSEKAVTPFGVEIKRLRQKAGITQAQLASRAGVSAGYVGLIETGDRGDRPSLDIVKRFAQVCDATLEETEQLLRITGHLSEHETLMPTERPSLSQFLSSDKELTKEQKAILISMYRSWVGHD